MRERAAALDPRPRDTAINYTVESIGAAEAKAFILRYEFLGTVGHPSARYGARNTAGELVAVALFGLTHKTDMDGAIVLERGACAHFAHEHTASWFIPKACAMAARDHGWKIFYAFADEDAGEIGTVYQACNWIYLGRTPERTSEGMPRTRSVFRRRDWPKGKTISDRTFYRKRLSAADLDGGEWQEIRKSAKHKYAWAPDRKLLCTLSALPYPKRTAAH